MSSLAKPLLEQALALEPADRALVAEELYRSLDPPTTEYEVLWAAEIERRLAAYDRGDMKSCSVDEVLAELDAA